MRRKGKGNDTAIFLCFLVGIPLYLLVNYSNLIIILLAIIAVIIIISVLATDCKKKKELENITSVQLVERAKIYKEGFENTGFSIGTSGHGRAYFGKRKHPQGVEATFCVTYSDKPMEQVKAMEGSEQYFKLLSYIERQDKQEMNKHRAEQKEKETKELIAKQELQAQLKELESKKMNDRKYYIEVPFEVLPNEFGLEIFHQSCQIVIEYGQKKIRVRFEVRYNTETKGARNRRIVCAALDSEDKIVSVNRERTGLDKSGGKIMDIVFWDNIEEDPSKVTIGLERIN